MACKTTWTVGKGQEYMPVLRISQKCIGHLGAWGGTFADRVEAATQDDFYRFSARLLRGFLLAECQLLGVEPAQASGVGPRLAVVPPQAPEPLTCPFAPECPEVSGRGGSVARPGR